MHLVTWAGADILLRMSTSAKRHVILLLMLLAALLPHPAHAESPCDPPNILPGDVCNFNSFYGSSPRQLPNGWYPVILSGELTYMEDTDTAFGAPSLRMWSDGGTFRAGIYTQAKVTPGATYRASIGWGAPNEPDTFSRQLGIDPTGGVDANSPTVVWGPAHWGAGRILNRPAPGLNIDVRAQAKSETITVFFLTDHNRSTGSNFIYVDAIALYPDEAAAASPTTAADASPNNGASYLHPRTGSAARGRSRRPRYLHVHSHPNGHAKSSRDSDPHRHGYFHPVGYPHGHSQSHAYGNRDRHARTHPHAIADAYA